MIDEIRSLFYNKFSSKGAMYAAPGRVNLIGEHTDYNNGFVLPGAINKSVILEIAPNYNEHYNIFAADLEQEITFEANGQKSDLSWANYIIGVVMEMKERGFTAPGFDCVFRGNIPRGGGMSSSAALESAFAFAINDMNHFNISKKELAKIGQMTEHNYAGVRCGIMDQFASLHGEKEKLIRLDCRSLEYEMIPFRPQGYKLLLIDTRVKHALANSEYNVRRAQCEEGVAIIQKSHPEAESLRDVSEVMLNKSKEKLSPVVFQRCLYVIQENERLMRACEALKQDDFISFGKEMFRSHDGLSKQYEVSCDRLDFLVEFARNFPGVAGARMMGGGFGGCTINLISAKEYQSFMKSTTAAFEKQFGKKPFYYEVSIENGARKIG
ncbi:MAG: galactokinase [Bacteroidetes bacterium GWF2_43_63]|nr:MAG: galactokinase [Bacteroidetes bacterium GWE2_42_42]OFY55145.1 MAG: galactokinase [Bacteroidetes bacterium GWF2_43_63]HBG70235.1 galactokinase [Bacteroidales bacterium]HCB63093.1 galactokinase [Bacteroidales bacterium]HCY22688.1 galactokinase [Bacteroidales bacterium]